MTPSRWLLLLAVVGLICFAWGRQSASPPTVAAQETLHETITTGEHREAAREETAAVSAQEAQEARTEAASGRVRVVYREMDPDGSTRELELEAEVAHLLEEVRASRAVEVEAAASELRVETVELVREVEVERRVEVTQPLPDWRLGIAGGIDVGAVPGLAWGLSVERRILGPVSVGATVISGGGHVAGLVTVSFDLL